MAGTTDSDGQGAARDLFEQVDSEREDIFERINLDVILKDDLYEMVGAAIKDAMKLRETFPVRLTTPQDVATFVDGGEGTFIDLYLAETGTLIEQYFAQIAGRVAHFVNDELS